MARGAGSRTIGITVDLDAFKELVRQVADASDDAVIPAADAGAKVIYQATREATPMGEKGHWFTGYNYKDRIVKGVLKAGTGQRYWFNAGTLRASIYHVLSKDNSGPGYATYHISWNYKKAPYAFMVHNGTSKAAARPFVIMGYERAAVAAQDAAANTYIDILTKRGLLS